MAFTQSVWNQFKNRTASDLIRALKADGWKEDINAAPHGHFAKPPTVVS